MLTGLDHHTAENGDRVMAIVSGEYYVSCDGAEADFAVSILESADMAGRISRVRPAGLCIVRVRENQEIGLCNIIKNAIARPMIRYLLVCGIDPAETFAGRLLIAVKENGVNRQMGVIGFPGEPVILSDVSIDEIAAFREHIDVVDLTGVDDAETIVAKIGQLSRSYLPRECHGCIVREKPATATDQARCCQCPLVSGLDHAGYFLIKPDTGTGMLTVEHYYYDRRLLRRIEGENTRAIFRTIIDNGWVTESRHAGYLWRELNRAEQAIKEGLKYIQDIELLPG